MHWSHWISSCHRDFGDHYSLYAHVAPTTLMELPNTLRGKLVHCEHCCKKIMWFLILDRQKFSTLIHWRIWENTLLLNKGMAHKRIESLPLAKRGYREQSHSLGILCFRAWTGLGMRLYGPHSGFCHGWIQG